MLDLKGLIVKILGSKILLLGPHRLVGLGRGLLMAKTGVRILLGVPKQALLLMKDLLC